MKRCILLAVILLMAACSSNPNVMRFDGKGGHYAYSPRVYSYLDFFGYPYYGPYSMAWYHPVWYSPVSGYHYRWRCSGYYWGRCYDPYSYWSGYYSRPIAWRAGSSRDDGPARASRPIPPVDLSQIVIEAGDSRYRMDHRAYRTRGSGRQPTAGSPSGGYRSPHSTSGGRYSTPGRASSGRTTRPPVVRRDSEHEY